MTADKIEKIASSLLDLESPVLEARNLAMAIRMMGSGDEVRGEPADPFMTVAGCLVEILEEIEAARQETLRIASSDRNHPKPTVKARRNALRIVDQPSDGEAT